MSFHHFSVEQGLPNYSVISLTQDKLGFMWIGTVDGLCRYDGLRFKVYRYNAKDSTSLSSNHVISLFTDSKGVVWAGTSAGLNRYNVKLDRFDRIPLNKARAGGVFCIYEDSQERIWVGSIIGLFMMDEKGGSVVSFQNKTAGNIIKAISEDKKNGYGLAQTRDLPA
ncbi:ligand-binding sensor domain-containing protein [Niabella hibiscisoli]|uniref:ligand-binding sensor domain-containing protein n=1 Tax=Niabella hibiscisoli TaxID=1825928 RepID=UPI001F0D35C5|nr:two-component regulator propeller domain-containing protein [Niabella hibiscisoli]MCH5716160.1 hypothetical protein [Niabella hibiscisoli]